MMTDVGLGHRCRLSLRSTGQAVCAEVEFSVNGWFFLQAHAKSC
jgi:hypothetical protein